MLPVPVFVVSLARATERRADITAHLKRLGVTFEIVDAVDGSQISPERRRLMQAEATDLQPGAIGCYLSHMEVYRRMLAAKLPFALVLEDDARLSSHFAPALHQRPKSLDFDYCFLDCADTNLDGPVFYNRADGVEVFSGYTAFATHAGPATTHAYLITRHAAARRLEFEFPIHQPVDIYSTLPYRPVFRVFASPRPAGVSEQSLRSLITSRDHLGKVRFLWLRRQPSFQALRDTIDPNLRALLRSVPERVRAGSLPAGGDWRPLPPGRSIYF